MVRWYQWMVAVCAALFSVAAFAELPDRFVEYVESTNNMTYVDTLIAASPKYTHMTVRLAITAQTSTQSGVFGAATSDGGNNASASILYASEKFRADWTGSRVDTKITPAVGDIYEFDCHYSDVFVAGKRFYKEGASEMQKGGSNDYNLYLFNFNLSGEPYSNGGVLQRVYGCRIYNESIESDATYTRTLSANLIPCEKGGVAGLWDSVSSTILYPTNFPLVASAADNPGVKVENGAVYALLTQANDNAHGALATVGATWVEVGATATVAPTANAGFQAEYASTHEGFAQARTYGGATLSFAMPAWPVEVSVGYADADYLPHVSDFAPYIAAASAGDTLRLGPGTYSIARRIALDKGVTLQGAGRDATVIKQLFGTKDRAVNISVAGATIRDLTVCAFTNSINGNGIYMTAGTADTVRVTMDYCYHYNSQQGVGIYMAGGVVTNSLIDHNSGHAGYGGCAGLGVHMNSPKDASPTLLVDSEISDNFRKKAETMGIGVRIQGSSPNHVLRCRILRNTSNADTNTGRGGNGVYLNDATKSIVEECVIASNGWNGVYMNKGTVRNCLIYGHVTTASGREAGVRMSNGYFYNNTVAGNSSVTAYSGMIMTGGTAVNNIIYGNTGDGDLTVSGGTFKTNVVGTASYTGGTVDGNIASDPLFTDAPNADYTIGFDSPAFGAGVAIADVTHDLVGTARPQGDAYDIGCYEYVADVSSLQAAIVVSQSEYGSGDTAGATSRVVGGSGTYLYAWHLDGALLEGETGDTLSLPASQVGSGYHTIRLVVTDATDASLSTEYTYANAWTVKPTTVYVSTTGSDTYPYDTAETAAASLNSAFSALYFSSSVTGTMHIAGGEYALSGALTLSGPVRILGAGRDATVINGADLGTAVRAFTLSHADAVVKDLTIMGCTNNLSGPAIYMDDGWVENVRSTRNTAFATGSSENAASGVGIYMAGGVATNCLFDANRQMTGYGWAKGAGIYISGGLAVDCEVTDNTKTSKIGRNMGEVQGTGVHMYGGSGKLLRCNIHGNATTINPADNSYGTGLYIDSGWGTSAAVAENCTIWSNGVQGVYVAHGTLRNSLVWGHATTHASHPAGVIVDCSEQNNAYLYNCTIAGNTATAAENADLLMVAGTAKNNIAVAATVSGGTSANNLFNVNPNFKNALAGNFRLSAGSPAIDAGDNDAWSGLAASCDLDGNDRIKRKVVDIGCYEYNGTGLLIFVR